MSMYRGTVHWSSETRSFVVDLGEAGGTQVVRREDADAMAREYLWMMTDEPHEQIEVELVDVLPPKVAALVAEMDTISAQVDALRKTLGMKNRETVTALTRLGMSGRQVAGALHISPQRVSQIARSGTAAHEFVGR